MTNGLIREKLMEIVNDAVDSAMIDYDIDNCKEIDEYEASEATDYIADLLTNLFKK